MQPRCAIVAVLVCLLVERHWQVTKLQRSAVKVDRIHSFLVKMEFKDPWTLLSGEPPSQCIDVGGHVGNTADKTAAMGHNVTVFEPFEGNLAQLRGKVEKHGLRVVVRHGAVDEVEGSVILEGATTARVSIGEQGEKLTSTSSAIGHIGDGGCQVGVDAGCVRSYQLDMEFPSERILFLKIDVQGAELRVLKGATRMLADHRVRYIWAEYSGNGKIITLLESYGYMCFDTMTETVGKSPDTLRGQAPSIRGKYTRTTGAEVSMQYFKNRYGAMNRRAAGGRDERTWWEDMRSLGAEFQTDILCMPTEVLTDE
jgi:FkbM family methyltransferase